MSNLPSQLNSVQKSVDNIESNVNKADEKALGVNVSPHVAPAKMNSAVAAEHGIRPPQSAGNAATTGQSNAYNLPD